MLFSFTNKVTPPPIFIEEVVETTDSFSAQLYLYSIKQADLVIETYQNLINIGSFYYLFDLILLSCYDSIISLPVAALQFYFTGSINSFFLSQYKTSSTYIQEIIYNLKTEEQVLDYIKNFLEFKSFSITKFLEDPMYLITWCISIDVSLTYLLNTIKNKNITQFFVNLIYKETSCDITLHPYSVVSLAENIQIKYFNYVLGATQRHATL